MADETQASRNAEGFFFLNAEDAGMALKEKKQIEYLEANLNFGNPEQVLTLYERMLRERVFKTPVGVIYLKHLQDFLLSQESIDSARVPMIPVYAPCADGPQRQERPRRAVAAPRTGEAKQDSARLRLSIFLNVLLAAAVCYGFEQQPAQYPELPYHHPQRVRVLAAGSGGAGADHTGEGTGTEDRGVGGKVAPKPVKQANNRLIFTENT